MYFRHHSLGDKDLPVAEGRDRAGRQMAKDEGEAAGSHRHRGYCHPNVLIQTVASLSVNFP